MPNPDLIAIISSFVTVISAFIRPAIIEIPNQVVQPKKRTKCIKAERYSKTSFWKPFGCVYAESKEKQMPMSVDDVCMSPNQEGQKK